MQLWLQYLPNNHGQHQHLSHREVIRYRCFSTVSIQTTPPSPSETWDGWMDGWMGCFEHHDGRMTRRRVGRKYPIEMLVRTHMTDVVFLWGRVLEKHGFELVPLPIEVWGSYMSLNWIAN